MPMGVINLLRLSWLNIQLTSVNLWPKRVHMVYPLMHKGSKYMYRTSKGRMSLHQCPCKELFLHPNLTDHYCTEQDLHLAGLEVLHEEEAPAIGEHGGMLAEIGVDRSVLLGVRKVPRGTSTCCCINTLTLESQPFILYGVKFQ